MVGIFKLHMVWFEKYYHCIRYARHPMIGIFEPHIRCLKNIIIDTICKGSNDWYFQTSSGVVRKNYHWKKKFYYAHDRDRTCDRWLIRPMLYQLSYTSLKIDAYCIVWGQAGIEPATSRTLNENHTTRPLAHYYDWLPYTYVRIRDKKIFWYAPTRARTGDLSVNSRPLCQLSHGSYHY